MIESWPCPVADGAATEFALSFDRRRHTRLLILPALFDEANRMRRLTVQTMRRLDALGIDVMLPDLPGTNESRQPLETVTVDSWRAAMNAAARHFGATHALAIRGGALVRPPLPGPDYAPAKGASILRQLLRARILSSREAGHSETAEQLLAQGMEGGLVLAGYSLGAALIGQLQRAEPSPGQATISQSDIGGGGLWLRAEPSNDPAQAEALATRIAAMVTP